MIFFAESCWRLNIERKYFSRKVVKICDSLPSKFIFNVILIQKLQVFYSEDFQKKYLLNMLLHMLIEKLAEIYRISWYVHSKALSHYAVCN